MKWKDRTGGSRSDKERVPREWELSDGPLQLSVHRWRGLDGWCMTLRFDRATLIDRHELDAEVGDAAKVEAVVKAKRNLQDLRSATGLAIDFLASVT